MATIKKTVIITSSVVGALLIGGSIYAFWPQISSIWSPSQSQQAADEEAKDAPVASTQKSQETYNKAIETAQTDGVEAGQKVLDDALSSSSTDKEKADIYRQKATLETSGSPQPNIPTALEYAYESEKLDPTYGSALTIATLEDQSGNTAAAITYYRFYLDRLSDDASAQNPGDYQYYEKRLAELEAGN